MLPVDAAVADEWGHLTAQSGPRTPPTVDALLAATARPHRLAIVTRNVVDFAATGVPVIDPWAAPED